MNYEELLKTLTGEEPIYTRDILCSTLTAVVELHKPDKYYPEYCGVCWWEEHERETYPCQTIQAIEEKLR